jgi:outer membrane immunogenic protein
VICRLRGIANASLPLGKPIMRRLQCVLLAAVAAIGFASMASAADLPLKAKAAPAPILYNWTGLYAGVSGGWAGSSQDWTAVGGVTTGNFTGSGGLIGGTLGYNYQMNKLVIGVEGDASWANINATDTTTGGCSPAFRCLATVNFLATARGRLGFAADRWLFYVTGGAAFANINNDQSALSPLASANTTKAGWTAGGGVEAVLWGNWSAKAEYLRAEFGQTPFCPAAGCGVVVVSNYTHLDIVRVGLNYKFGGPVVAKY